MDAAFGSPAYAGAVKADEGDFVEKHLGGLILGHRQGPDAPPAGAQVRLMTFLRRAPGADRDAFAAAVTGLPKPDGAVAREVMVALPPEKTGGRASIYDAVDMLWMPDAKAAQRFATSRAARERAHPSAGLIRGMAHLVAEVRVIR
jgi:hypothetical protein